MSTEARRAIRAFVLAPLAAPLLWWASILVLGQSGAKGFVNALGGLLLIILTALPWIYGSAIAVGIPSFLAIRRWSRLRAWHPPVIATCIGALVSPFTSAIPTTLRMLLTGGALGAGSGVAFWLLYREAG